MQRFELILIIKFISILSISNNRLLSISFIALSTFKSNNCEYVIKVFISLIVIYYICN